MRRSTTRLDLGTLFEGRPGLTPSEGGVLAECAVLCLEVAGHTAPPPLRVTGRHRRRFPLAGPVVTPQMRRSYGDLQEATEFGACGIAVLVMEACEGLTVIERARKDGGGFDYYLAPVGGRIEETGDNIIVPATARLEVSGILVGRPARIRERVSARLRRLRARRHRLPCLVLVVEFGTPVARLEQV